MGTILIRCLNNPQILFIWPKPWEAECGRTRHECGCVYIYIYIYIYILYIYIYYIPGYIYTHCIYMHTYQTKAEATPCSMRAKASILQLDITKTWTSAVNNKQQVQEVQKGTQYYTLTQKEAVSIQMAVHKLHSQDHTAQQSTCCYCPTAHLAVEDVSSHAGEGNGMETRCDWGGACSNLRLRLR